ncbi:MAG: toll/interleukin-1 receptor domain-containing protein [Chloroflexota bacterium]
MDNPLHQPAPADKRARMYDFARDIAWGFFNDHWTDNLREFRGDLFLEGADTEMAEAFAAKWPTETRPSMDQLKSLGLLRHTTGQYFCLTPNAYDLLDAPAKMPSVFISYARAYSTTFALYLEARLRVVGNKSVFIDKSLEPGSDWRESLKEKVQSSQYLVILIDQGTLDSRNVRDEIEWALEAGVAIVPIFHHVRENGLPQKGSLKEVGLGHVHAIQASDKTAQGYEYAANALLNVLGYATY